MINTVTVPHTSSGRIDKPQPFRLTDRTSGSQYLTDDPCVTVSFPLPVVSGLSYLFSETQTIAPSAGNLNFISLVPGTTNTVYCLTPNDGHHTLYIWERRSGVVQPNSLHSNIYLDQSASPECSDLLHSSTQVNVGGGVKESTGENDAIDTGGTGTSAHWFCFGQSFLGNANGGGSDAAMNDLRTAISDDKRVLIAGIRSRTHQSEIPNPSNIITGRVHAIDGSIASSHRVLSHEVPTGSTFYFNFGQPQAFDIAWDPLTQGWIVAWANFSSSTGASNPCSVWFRRFDRELQPRDANAVQASFTLSSTSFVTTDNMITVCCDDLGRFTIAVNYNGSFPFSARMIRYLNDGTTIDIPETTIFSGAPTGSGYIDSVIHRPSNKFAIVYSGTFKRFDAAGSLQSTLILPLGNNVTISGRYGSERVLALAGGLPGPSSFKFVEVESDGTLLYPAQNLNSNLSSAIGAGYYLNEPGTANDDYKLLFTTLNPGSGFPSKYGINSFVYAPSVPPALMVTSPAVTTEYVNAVPGGVLPIDPVSFWAIGHPKIINQPTPELDRIDLYRYALDKDPSPNGITLKSSVTGNTNTAFTPVLTVDFACPVLSPICFLISDTQTLAPLSSNTNFVCLTNAVGSTSYTLTDTSIGRKTVFVWFKAGAAGSVVPTPFSDSILLADTVAQSYSSSARLVPLTTITKTYSSSGHIITAVTSPVTRSYNSSGLLNLSASLTLTDKINNNTILTKEHVVSTFLSIASSAPPASGWMLSETQTTQPLPSNPGFTNTLPQTFALATIPDTVNGEKQIRTVYLWVKNSTEVLNSLPGIDTIQLGDDPTSTLSLSDTVSNSVSLTASRVVSTTISAFQNIRDGAVNGYLITEGATAPAYNNAGWVTTVPSTFQLASGNGVKTVALYTRNRYSVSVTSSTATIDLEETIADKTFTYILKRGNNIVSPALETTAPIRAGHFILAGDFLFFQNQSGSLGTVIGGQANPDTTMVLEAGIGYLVVINTVPIGQIRTLSIVGPAWSN